MQLIMEHKCHESKSIHEILRLGLVAEGDRVLLTLDNWLLI